MPRQAVATKISPRTKGGKNWFLALGKNKTSSPRFIYAPVCPSFPGEALGTDPCQPCGLAARKGESQAQALVTPVT